MNILRPAVLRQYFGKNVPSNEPLDNEEKRQTYGSGSGTSSVGMDKYNFVTRRMTPGMEKLSLELRTFVICNKKYFNLENVDMSQKCNHCSVIQYYVGLELKRCFRLDFHSDYVFSTQNGTFVSSSNYQVKNASAEIYLLGDSCVLNWRKRIFNKIKRSRNY